MSGAPDAAGSAARARIAAQARTGVGVAVAAATATAAAAWAIHGAGAAVEMLEILVPVGLLAVAGVTMLLGRRERLGGLRRQLTLIGALAVAQLLLSVGALVWFMFVSVDAALLTAIAAVYAGAVSAWVASAMAAAAGAEERARTAAERAHRDLLAAVSHDLRTPLTSLRLLADALADDVVEEEARREYLLRMGTHVRALSSLIDDLFELSRLQAGEIRWTMEGVELHELVFETVEAMKPEAEAAAVAMSAQLAAPVIATANPEQIQRVLFNLIRNAIHHTPADGSVTVRAQRATGEVVLEVSDTGSGIAESDRERVFEPFYRGAGSASRSDGGAGLGLAIARAIVEAHGGRIWLSGCADGTSVRFTLPAAG